MACRQWFSRAKKHLSEHRPRFPASPDTQRQLLTSFYQAVQAGEMTALMNMLAEDVTLWADGGGKVIRSRYVFHEPTHLFHIGKLTGKRSIFTILFLQKYNQPGKQKGPRRKLCALYSSTLR